MRATAAAKMSAATHAGMPAPARVSAAARMSAATAAAVAAMLRAGLRWKCGKAEGGSSEEREF